MTACNAPRDASLFRTTPFAFWDASNEMLIRRLRAPERTHERSVARMSDTYMRITPTCILLDVNTSPEARGDLWLDVAYMDSQTPTRDFATRHPSQ
jgi:hypothetical protein